MSLLMEEDRHEIEQYDHYEPFEVVEAAQYALETISELQDKLFVLEAAKHSSLAHQAQVLRLARQHRQSVIDRYQVTGVMGQIFATESLDNPHSLVLALEAEENDSKGLIAKLVDGIINAFKWLWEKFTGLFKSGETPDEAAKGAKLIEDRLEEAITANKELPAGAALEGKRWDISFGQMELGTAVTLGQLTPVVQQHVGYKKALCDAIEALSKAIRETSVIPADKLADKIDAALKSTLKTPYKPDTHGKYAILAANVTPVADKSYVVGPIAGRAGPVLVAAVLTGSMPAMKYVAKAGKLKTKATPTGFKITLPGKVADLKPYLEEVKKLRIANAEAAAELSRQQGAIKSDFAAIETALKNAKNTKDITKETAKSLTDWLRYIQSAGGIEVALGGGIVELDRARENFEGVVAQALNLAEGKKAEGGEENKAKPEEPAAEAPKEKPEEGGTAPAAA